MDLNIFIERSTPSRSNGMDRPSINLILSAMKSRLPSTMLDYVFRKSDSRLSTVELVCIKNLLSYTFKTASVL